MAHDGLPDRLLSWSQVQDRIGLGRTTAWRLRRAGDFPHPVPLSPGRVAWRERDIIAWTESRGAALSPLAPPRTPVVRRPPEAPILPASSPEARPSLPPPISASDTSPDAASRPARTRRPSALSDQLGFDF